MNDPLVIRDWALNASTSIWTGDLNRNNDRFIYSSVLGSIRWWFEVVIRGLSGSACDPSVSVEDSRNPNGSRCPGRSVEKPSDPGHHCIACELFGCTGWSRKFRFQVLAETGEPFKESIKAGNIFKLRFVPLRHVRDEEWQLLNLTLKLIADYGALGGKTVLKPSDEATRQDEPHHRDYGLVQIVQAPIFEQRFSIAQLRALVGNNRWRAVDQHDFAWASLVNFWFVKGRYLRREAPEKSTFNKVLGRKEDKEIKERNGKRVVRWSDLFVTQDEASRWLAGGRRESKKVFSFKNPARTFGFVKPGVLDFEQIKQKLRQVWPKLEDSDFIAGDKVLGHLLDR